LRLVDNYILGRYWFGM